MNEAIEKELARQREAETLREAYERERARSEKGVEKFRALQLGRGEVLGPRPIEELISESLR